jgi:sulfide:quinone oxidoreductase
MSLPQIIVLGAGLGGTIAAYEIRDAVKGKAQVMVVNDQDDYWFVPSNPWVAVRWREPDAIRCICRRSWPGKASASPASERARPPCRKPRRAERRNLAAYDYLVIATGPELAFDEIEGLGPMVSPSRSAAPTTRPTPPTPSTLLRKPRPIVVGAAQGASCFGPAYEFALILDTELRRRKIRDQVPMTFVSPEPYIGHLGLDGVGDTKTLLESELRDRHIKWITSARITKVEEGMMHVEELADDGSVKKHALPFGYSMILPAFRGVAAVQGIEGLTNPRGFILADKHQRNPTSATSIRWAYAWRFHPSAPRRCRWACPRPGS